ncbi:MAG TPA: PQQ-binding-like beta-propeller repeat protein [Bryobacteraceae bacterium]|jgi:outer membrane protein assembly factor BamB|nr:PQQ-binding-like beta-propeller repeat protein [Bryobacteraceae bacterium]
MRFTSVIVAALAAVFVSISSYADWLTFAHDAQRTGWAPEETHLTPENVSGMSLLWKSKLDVQSYSLFALTAPVVASDVSTRMGPRTVVYVAGISGAIFALDAETGETLWTHTFKNFVDSRKNVYMFQGGFLCPNGITATPVIDKSTGTLYFIGPDGMLYGVDLGDGSLRYGPVQFVAPFSKSWSLNLVDGRIYTTLSQGCGNGISGFYSIDIRDRHHPVIQQGLLSNTNTAGVWGRGGPVIGANGRVYGGTADGKFDALAGDYSDSVVSASLKDLRALDYYLPPNWDYLRKKDFDLGSASPVYFGWRNRNLVAHGAKEGVVYLLDADSLGGNDHQTPLYVSPRLGNDRAVCCEGLGIWGGLSTARDATGQTWLFVPMAGPPAVNGPAFPITNGDNPHGSVMAFRVVADAKTREPALEPAWISGDFDHPDPVVIANGIVFALSNGENAVQHGGEKLRLENTHPAVLKALDAKTGKEIFNSGTAMTGWVHFSGIALSGGRVFAVDHDSTVYCFGLQPKTSN